MTDKVQEIMALADAYARYSINRGGIVYGGHARIELESRLREVVAPPVPEDCVMVDRGALHMVINALRRDAKDGRLARGEMADMLEGAAPTEATHTQPASEPVARADALNTLCKMLHSGEEVEGDDGLAMLVPMDLWNEAQEAIESLVGEDDATPQPAAKQAEPVARDERAYNAGFVAASRMHGKEIVELRAALAASPTQPAQLKPCRHGHIHCLACMNNRPTQPRPQVFTPGGGFPGDHNGTAQEPTE